MNANASLLPGAGAVSNSDGTSTECSVPENGASQALASVPDKALTPLMQQYFELKAKNPKALLLFRCGDFYETFFEDAITAARELSITLTARGRHKGDPVPLAGVPYHSVMPYVSRLVAKGFTVAICEQMEDPKLAKGIVKREIVRLLTPGTIADPVLLEENSNNYLVAFGSRGGRFFLATAELSTGEVLTCAGDSAESGMLPEEFVRLRPRELLLLDSGETAPAESETTHGTAPADRPWALINPELHLRKISDADALASLEGMYPGEHRARFLSMTTLELKTLGILAEYLLDTQKCSLAHLRYPAPYRLGDGMVLDEATLRNLELLPEGRQTTLGGTLFETLNRTRTAMGARLLKRRLTKPLIKAESIRERQGNVQVLVENALLLAEIRERLERMPDLERILSKLMLGGRGPRDLLAIGQGLIKLPSLKETISKSPLSDLASTGLSVPSEVGETLVKGLVDNPPANLADGGVIADGIDPEIDDLRRMMRDGDSWLREYEEKEREKTGIRTLKVRKNSVFGYFIEISKSVTDKAPAHYVRKQTLTTGERYITAELKEYESKVFSAHDRVVALEKERFETFLSLVRGHIRPIQEAARVIAELDFLASLAAIALEKRYTRPEITDEPVLKIREGRHPVVEAFLGPGRFMPNDLEQNRENLQAIITGPNMAGKSTYLRQNALIILLAQIGSYVPATNAVIGVVDRIFTRVGASDNLIRGQSTFMVEMMETSAILSNATNRSFLVLDEIGRGTSTFDGLALAWAILESIHDNIGSRTLFATHYHELTDLSDVHASMYNLNVGVAHDEASGEMVFMHKIENGPASKSYGIEVARLAGVPGSVIDRAREILFELEKSEEDEMKRVTRSSRTSVGRPGSPGGARLVPQQLSLFSPTNELAETLRGVNLDETTPIEALNLLVRLKRIADAD
ncbi:MAG: DNA mismatch repair protein MutS [Candidatus Riflebacteria bacterium]|nr:DNA mismatch repair protein MutS [Candidatus Riflebacteria bacterium]